MTPLKQRRAIIINEIHKHLKRAHPDTNGGKGDPRLTRMLNEFQARVERIYQMKKANNE